MKLLITAHPDDELLWFNPLAFDKIIICFLERLDRPDISEARRRVLVRHPLKNKMECLKLTESDYWRNKLNLGEHQKNYQELKKLLRPDIKKAEIIYTHNPWGEYKDHTDHIMVSQVVTELAKVPVFAFDGIIPTTARLTHYEKMDLDFYRKVRDLYIEEGAWTWFKDYEPPIKQSYFQINL